MTTDDSDLRRAVTAEYLALAEVLASAPAADWDKPSLCEGWRVREVVAHVTMPARYDQEAFMTELRARDFDFGRLSDEIAAQDGRLPTEVLIENLRDETLHGWVPPEGGERGALNHVVIHGLDVTVPIGVGRRPADDVMRVVLDDLTGAGVHEHFGTSTSGRRLEATDLDWTYGSGAVLRGTAADLALALCGRRIPAGRLEGEPIDGAI